VFVIGMPIKIAIGLIIMMITMPVFIAMIDMIVNGMDSNLYTFVKDMVLK
jgi:flagellar biosynthesis protein FliR